MAIAQSWVLYENTSPFSVVTEEMLNLDFGIIEPGNWAIQVIGLKFQGEPVNNIKAYLSSYRCDAFIHSGSTFNFINDNLMTSESGDLHSGYQIKVLELDPNSSDYSSQVANFALGPSSSSWTDFSTIVGNAHMPISLHGTMDKFFVTRSSMLAIALYVPSGQSDALIKNLKLFCEFDTN